MSDNKPNVMVGTRVWRNLPELVAVRWDSDSPHAKPENVRIDLLELTTVDRERLAAVAHDRWSRLMIYMLGKFPRNDDGGVTFPGPYVANLLEQANKAYSELSEGERDYDRTEADAYLELLNTGQSRTPYLGWGQGPGFLDTERACPKCGGTDVTVEYCDQWYHPSSRVDYRGWRHATTQNGPANEPTLGG